MKRIITLFMAVILILCTAGCETPDETNENPNAKISRGTVDGNVYTSEFTELTFTKPDHWRYLTDEELANALGIGVEALEAKEFEKTVMEYPNIPDMMVINDTTGFNMTIGYENPSMTMGKSVSEAEYIETAKEYMATFGNAEFTEPKTVTLGEHDYLKAAFTIKLEDSTEVESVYYLRLMGDIMTVISVTSPAGSIDTDIESMFS